MLLQAPHVFVHLFRTLRPSGKYSSMTHEQEHLHVYHLDVGPNHSHVTTFINVTSRGQLVAADYHRKFKNLSI